MIRLSLVFGLVLVAANALRADELKTLSGKNVVGTVKSVSDTEIVLAGKEGTVTTPLAQALLLDVAPVRGAMAGTKFLAVRLVDDALLQCKSIAFGGDKVRCVLTTGTEMTLPLASVAWFLRDADDSGLRKKFEALAKKSARADRIVIVRDGELNPLDGTLGAIDAAGKTIQFKREGLDPIPIQLERASGLIFFRPEGPAEATICRVYDRDGNVLAASKLAFQGDAWKLTTPFGAAVELPGAAIAKLDFNFGRLTYLSDLEPTKVVERSTLGLVVRYRKDANLDGEPILIDRRYAKGLSMHAYTELEFDLGGKYKELRGALGVDVRCGPDSRPTVTIWCDGEKRFSDTVTSKALVPINVNVKDVTTLRIEVRSRNELDLHDHVSFVDARVSQ